MRTTAYRNMAVAGIAVAALIIAGCSNGESVEASQPPQVGLVATSEIQAALAEVKLTGERDVEVTLTGPIAAKYSSATQSQREALGKPLTGDRNAGTRESGVVFQQFQGGVITARGDAAGMPAYITWGKIRRPGMSRAILVGRHACGHRRERLGGSAGHRYQRRDRRGRSARKTFEHAGLVRHEDRRGRGDGQRQGRAVRAIASRPSRAWIPRRRLVCWCARWPPLSRLIPGSPAPRARRRA